MALLKNELSVSVFVTAVWPGEKSDWSKLEGRATITVFNDCTLIAAGDDVGAELGVKRTRRSDSSDEPAN
ncbi:MAG: hypothetical protein ACXWNK_04410 [Vulcanimicrobiaceae bacterium]